MRTAALVVSVGLALGAIPVAQAAPATHEGARVVPILGDSGVMARQHPRTKFKMSAAEDVTFKYLDANGQPAAQCYTTLAGEGEGLFEFYDDCGAEVHRQVPAGHYEASVVIATMDGDTARYAVLSNPVFDVNGPREATFDARIARPVDVRVPGDGAVPKMGAVHVGWSAEFFEDGLGAVSIGHIGEQPAGLDAMITASFASGTETYRAAWPLKGGLPTGFTGTAKAEDFATVRTSFVPGPAGARHSAGMVAERPWDKLTTFDYLAPAEVGGEVVEHVTTNVRWVTDFEYVLKGDEFDVWNETPVAGLTAGGQYRQRVNQAVHGAGLLSNGIIPVRKTGNDLRLETTLFGDSRGGPGFSVTTSHRTTLFRDGVKVGEGGAWAGSARIPWAGPGSYRFEAEATRDVAEVSTRVSGAWTFQVSEQDGALPFTAVGFEPALTDDAAKVGALEVPLAFRQQPGTPAVTKTDVEVSFDDGQSWQAVPVADGKALVNNEKPGFASLRAKTVDAGGNTSEVTVIRAYRVTA